MVICYLQVVQTLSQLYESVEDIDLFIGGISERPIPGSLLGPTFLCLVGDQFARLKVRTYIIKVGYTILL